MQIYDFNVYLARRAAIFVGIHKTRRQTRSTLPRQSTIQSLSTTLHFLMRFLSIYVIVFLLLPRNLIIYIRKMVDL